MCVAEHGDEGYDAVAHRLGRLFAAPAPFESPASSASLPAAAVPGRSSPAATTITAEGLRTKVQEAVEIRNLLSRNTEELDSVMRCRHASFEQYYDVPL